MSERKEAPTVVTKDACQHDHVDVDASLAMRTAVNSIWTVDVHS